VRGSRGLAAAAVFFRSLCRVIVCWQARSCVNVVEQLVFRQRACGNVWPVHIGLNGLAEATLMTHGRLLIKRALRPCSWAGKSNVMTTNLYSLTIGTMAKTINLTVT